MHRRTSSYQQSPPSPLYPPPQHPSSPAPPPAPPPPPPPGTPTGQVYSNVPGRIGKLNQIVQNFFAKAAQIVIQSRISVTPTYQRGTNQKRTNKWFHMELDDTDTLRTELSLFRTATFAPAPPTPHPPLILEVTLDTRDLTPQQTLILVSSTTGKRHPIDSPSNRWLRGSEIVLEQWRIDLITPPKQGAPDLPVVYKKAVVLFRRVYTEARLMPVWRLKRRLAKVKLNAVLKLRVRIANADKNGRIGITVPLCNELSKTKVVDEFSFGQIDTPAGAFDISVKYRLETDFRVNDAETLLSDHFLNLDSSQTSLPGSISSSPRPRAYPLQPDQSQAYGSLSSFHTLPQPGQNLSSSPLTTLRNAPYMGQAGLLPSTPPQQITTPYVAERSPSQTSLSRLKDANAGLPRRPSVTFMQPFKAPSLSSSPADVPPSPRPGSTRSMARPSSLKESFTPFEDETPPASPSLEGERKRYSSSFSVRRERRESFRSEGPPRRRFSGISVSSQKGLEETESVSSGSYKDDEEDVGLFLKMVESRRELKGHSTGGMSDLERFKGLREGYGALGDSVSGSIYVSRVSPPTGRSVGSGESPHTPVVRSRLSEGVSSMEQPSEQERTPTPSQPAMPERDDTLKVPTTTTTASTNENVMGPGGATKPLDIPNSPSMRSWANPHHRATSFTDRRIQQDQDVSNRLLEEDLDSTSGRRHSSSLGSSLMEGFMPLEMAIRPHVTSNESNESPHARNVTRGRPATIRARSSGSGGKDQTASTERPGSINSVQGASLREKFYSAFAGGEEGDEGEELLFAMSDMMGDKR